MKKFASFIVDKRKWFLGLFVILVILSFITMPLTKINYDLTMFLPEETSTKKGLNIMNGQFVNYSMASFMVRNISLEEADKIHDRLNESEDVKMVIFDDTENHYKNANALFDVTLNCISGSEELATVLPNVKNIFKDYDVAIIAETVQSEYNAELQKSMISIGIMAGIIIFAVLIFTSKSYIEIIIYPIVFGVSILLNNGSHFLFGEISSMTNSIAPLLQLILAIDYAIILCHRFADELENTNNIDAMKIALSKSIPEIASSSLTTIFGMVALMFMKLKIGMDIGMVLTKGIILSLLTVFFLMPALLILFADRIRLSRHRNFIPSIRNYAKLTIKLRYVLTILFVGVVVFSFVIQPNMGFAYSNKTTDTMSLTKEQEDLLSKQETFGDTVMFAVLVPKSDYQTEKQLLKTISEHKQVINATGVSNIKIDEDTYLSDKMTYKQFSKALNIDMTLAQSIYMGYGAFNEKIGAITNPDYYEVPLVDILFFMLDQVEADTIHLDGEMGEMFDEMSGQFKDLRSNLIGKTHNRLIFVAKGNIEDKEIFKLIEEVNSEIHEVYGDEAVMISEAVASYEMSKAFEKDNKLTSILIILFIGIIVLLTFKSFSVPIMLLLVIQGSVWIAFGIQILNGLNMFFFAYLLGCAIQMGATIDYAIVLTNRYNELRAFNNPKESAIGALNQSFATIMTSGLILAVSTLILGLTNPDPLQAVVGMTLCRCATVSIISVITVLPGLLVILDNINKKCKFHFSFKKKKRKSEENAK